MLSPTEATSARRLFRSMATGSGLYLLPVIVQRIVSVFLLPITTRFLTPADYGVADLIEQVATIFYILLGTSFSSALGYFYFQADSAAARRPVVSTTVIGAAALGCLTGIAAWPFADVLSRTVFGDATGASYLRLVLVSMPFAFTVECLLSWLRVEDRAKAYAAASIARVALTVVGVVTLVAVFRLGIWGVLITAVGVMVILGVILAVISLREVAASFDVGLFARIARFAAPIGVAGLGMFVIHFGGRFVLPHYRPFADLGIFALASKIGMLIAVPYSSFHTWWSAQVFGVMRRDDAEMVLARMVTYVVAGVGLCGLGLTVASRPLLVLLAAPAYHGAAALIPAVLAAYALKCLGDFFRCLFLAEGRPTYDAVCTWIGAALCLGGYAVLIPRFGMWGAVWTTLATFAAILLVSLAWTWHIRRWRVEGGRLAKVMVALAIPLAAWWAAPVGGIIAQFGWASLLVASFPASLWALGFATPGERETLRGAAARTASVLGLGVRVQPR